jgi:hypothetical protein
VVNGAYQEIVAPAFTYAANTTYVISFYAKGNKYAAWINGTLVIGQTADTSNLYLTNTGAGMTSMCLSIGVVVSIDDFIALPLDVTLPSEIQAGAVPSVLAGGSTLALDAFTDTNGTRLGSHTPTGSGGSWTEHAGTFTINSNKVGVTGGASVGLATQNVASSDFEATVDITTPGSITTLNCGIVFRLVDTTNWMCIRLIKSASQPGADEIELAETIAAASGPVVHKAQIGTYYAAATTYNLKVQCKADLVHCFLKKSTDTAYLPLISYYAQSGSPVGTRAGLVFFSTSDACTFSNWQVKAL